MIKTRIFSFFLACLLLNAGSKCTNANKDKSRKLTSTYGCNFYINKNDEIYEYYFTPSDKPNKRIYISRNAQKAFWDSCLLVLQEDKTYLMVNGTKSDISIKKFNSFKSLDSAYYLIYGDLKEIKLHFSSGIYNSMPE